MFEKRKRNLESERGMNMLAGLYKKALLEKRFDEQLLYLYGEKALEVQRERYCRAIDCFIENFGEKDVELISAPGRTEIGGNHTDHQHGRVVAAAVDMDILAVAAKVEDFTIHLQSEGYPMNYVDLSDLEIHSEEINKSNSLLRGVCSRFRQLGRKIGGMEVYTTNNVLKGSGLSSSASFEVLVGSLLNYLYNQGEISPVEIAKTGQYAENVYFGKPSGLLDQSASAVGGFAAMDFRNPEEPEIERIDFDVERYGYTLGIVDTGGNHTDLTPDYAAVPQEMGNVAHFFQKGVLRDVEESVFFSSIPELRTVCRDRAVLRAIHFFQENQRAADLAGYLKEGNFNAFLDTVSASGDSSFMYLQNTYSPSHPEEQGIPLALALCKGFLKGKGACRVHGGGFAGAVQVYVPLEMVSEFRQKAEAVFGEGTFHPLRVRPCGAYCLLVRD